MLKKSIVAFAATVSLLNAAEEENISTTSLDQMIIKCLHIACEGGADLKTARNSSLVCKKWYELLPQSITNLDLISMNQKSKYRHLTLTAYLMRFPFSCQYLAQIGDCQNQRFPNLKKLSLDFHSSYAWEIELCLKLQLSEEELLNCTSPQSYRAWVTDVYTKLQRPIPDTIEDRWIEADDTKLNILDEKIEHFYSQIHTLFYKCPPRPAPRNRTRQELKEDLRVQGKHTHDLNRGRLATDHFNIDRMQKIMDIQCIGGYEHLRGDISDSLFVERKLVFFCWSFQGVETLIINPWNNMDIAFITQMPNLKKLKLIGHSGDVFDPYSNICLDGIGQPNSSYTMKAFGMLGLFHSPSSDDPEQIKVPHGLEKLELTGRLHLTSFEGWLKFENLRKLSLPIKFFDQSPETPKLSNENSIQITDVQQINERLCSLAENLPQLENLSLSYRLNPEIHLGEWIQLLPKLETLTFLHCFICDNDFDEISRIPNLKELYLNNTVDSKWEFWRAHMHSTLKEYIEVLVKEDITPCEKYTQIGLDSFQRRVPEVKIFVID